MGALRNLDVREVSLVDRPANRRRFLLWKSASPAGQTGGHMPTLTAEALTKVEKRLDVAPPGEEAVLSALTVIAKAAGQELTDETQTAATVMLRSAALTAIPDPHAKAAELAAVFGIPVQKAESTTKQETSKPPAPATLSAELAELAKADSSLTELITKAASESSATATLLTILLKRVAEKTATVAELTEKDAAREALAKAEAMDLPGVDKTKLAETIKKLSAAGLLAEVEPMLAALRKQVQESALYSETGNSRRGAGSTYAKVEQMADALVQKSADGTLTKAQAITKVLTDNPDLYQQYEAEKGGR